MIAVIVKCDGRNPLGFRKPPWHVVPQPFRGRVARAGLGSPRRCAALSVMVRAGGLEPPRAMPYGFSYPPRLSPPLPGRGAFGVWTIPSPFPARAGVRCCPSSLYTFPLPGLARDRHVTGFPEFEQFYVAGFPARTHVIFKSVASTIPPRPHERLRL